MDLVLVHILLTVIAKVMLYNQVKASSRSLVSRFTSLRMSLTSPTMVVSMVQDLLLTLEQLILGTLVIGSALVLKMLATLLQVSTTTTVQALTSPTPVV